MNGFLSCMIFCCQKEPFPAVAALVNLSLFKFWQITQDLNKIKKILIHPFVDIGK